MSVKSKGQKAKPELSYWQKYYRKPGIAAKYKAWGAAWRQRQKALKGQVVVTAQVEPASKKKCGKKKSD